MNTPTHVGAENIEDISFSSSPVFPPKDEEVRSALARRQQVVLPTPCPQVDMSKLIVVMVGLPARGKTYISRSIARYLNWMGVVTEQFNVGSYRRSLHGAQQRHSFFDSTNEDGRRRREEAAEQALQDLITWLQDGGQVAIYDATNTTRKRRDKILERLSDHETDAVVPADRVVFVESVCNDPVMVEHNIRETKLTSPDYSDTEPEHAAEDFLERIRHYERVYETLDDEHDRDKSYFKLMDIGRRVTMNNITGYLPGRIMTLLMNMHVGPRKVYLTRHGESAYNVQGKIGGDPDLSPKGRAYARALADFVSERCSSGSGSGSSSDPGSEDPVVWTSTLRRSIQSSRFLGLRTIQWKALDELDAGICDGMTYSAIAEQMPAEFEARRKDKFHYRYPRGESYQDIVHRVEPAILELEREERPLLIVCHQAVARVLYAYLKGLKAEDCTQIKMPLHTLIEMTPKAYGVDEERHELDIEPYLS